MSSQHALIVGLVAWIAACTLADPPATPPTQPGEPDATETQPVDSNDTAASVPTGPPTETQPTDTAPIGEANPEQAVQEVADLAKRLLQRQKPGKQRARASAELQARIRAIERSLNGATTPPDAPQDLPFDITDLITIDEDLRAFDADTFQAKIARIIGESENLTITGIEEPIFKRIPTTWDTRFIPIPTDTWCNFLLCEDESKPTPTKAKSIVIVPAEIERGTTIVEPARPESP
jgi:hypothetical protein